MLEHLWRCVRERLWRCGPGPRAILIAAFESRRNELAAGLAPDWAADLLLVATQGLRVVGATESKIGADSTIETVLDTLTPRPPACP